jgi:hypothetical protein
MIESMERSKTCSLAREIEGKAAAEHERRSRWCVEKGDVAPVRTALVDE